MTTTGKSIQQAVDGYLNDKIDPIYSFVIRGLSGTCSLPENVHVRFYDCDFDSLETAGNNILYLDNCNLNDSGSVYSLKYTAGIFTSCNIDKSFDFEGGKLELQDCSMSEAINLSASYMKTMNCDFTDGSGNAVTLKDNSRYESIKDVFSGFQDYFIDADEGSYVKLTDPKLSNVDQGIAKLQSNSSMVIWGTTDLNLDNSDNAFYLDNSSLEISNFSSITFDDDGFNLNNKSKLSIRGVAELSTTSGSLFKSSDSEIIITGNEKLSAASGSVFEFTHTNDVSISGKTSIQAKTIAIDMVEGSFKLVGDGTNRINSTNDEAIATNGTGSKATIFIKDVASITSDNGTTVNLESTEATFFNINTIESKQNKVLFAKNKCNIRFINVVDATGNIEHAVDLDNNCTLTINNSNSIIGNGSDASKAGILLNNGCTLIIKDAEELVGAGTAIDAQQNSTVLCDGLVSIRGGAADGIRLGVGCSVSIFNADEISGQINGIHSDAETGATLRLNAVGKVDGATASGLNIADTDVFIDGSGVGSGSGMLIRGHGGSGIKAVGTQEGIYSLDIKGKVTVDGSPALNATNYVVNETGVTWTGASTAVNTVIDTKYSSYEDLSTTNSIVRNTRGSAYGPNLNEHSYYEAIKSLIKTAAVVTNSTAVMIESQGENLIGSSNSALISYSSKTDLNGKDSFLGSFNSKGNVNQLAGSTVLVGEFRGGGSVTSVGGDAAFDDSYGGVFGSDKKLGIQASDTIEMESNILTTLHRATAVIEATTSLTTKVGSSTIVTTPDSITVTSATVEIPS